MKLVAVVAVVALGLTVAADVSAQNHHPTRNVLDQGSDGCPATVIYQAPYYDEGSTVGMANDFTATCASGANSPDVIYEFSPAQTDSYSVSLCGTLWDTAMHIREGGACPGDSQIACNDDYCGLASTIFIRLYSGHTYYIIVDGYGGSQSGSYHLYVIPHPGCDFGSVHSVPLEVSEYPINSVFYAHDPNGGCSADTASFQHYAWGYMLGRSFNYYGSDGVIRPDEDWYSFTVSEPETIKATIRAYFPIQLELLKLEDGCDSMHVLSATTLSTCWTDSLMHPCAAPGAYALRVTCVADSEMLIPQFYRLMLSHFSYCDCDTCPCDSVSDLTVFCRPNDHHASLYWSADSSGEIFTIYSTGDANASFLPWSWRTREIYATAEPGRQCWVDPETTDTYQKYVVVRYCP